MGVLTYATTVSLDGYVADASGDIDWGVPSPDVFDAHVERMARVSTEVLGRRTYELMTYWESEPADAEWSEAEREFARRWQGIDQVVVSSTLRPDDVEVERARLVRDLSLEELQQIVAEASGAVEIFGPTTAGPALRAGLVEELELFFAPVVLGGGLRAIPDGVRLDLRLVEQRAFEGGVTYARYVKR